MGTQPVEQVPEEIAVILAQVVPGPDGAPIWVGPNGEVVKIPGAWHTKTDPAARSFAAHLVRTPDITLQEEFERDPLGFIRKLKVLAAEARQEPGFA